jgi:SAM-dependent methyltransferase
MDLHLAIVLASTDRGCQTQLLDSDANLDAHYSDPMLEHGIVAQPGQLVAVDLGTDPPHIVYRYPHIHAVGAGPATSGPHGPMSGPTRVGAAWGVESSSRPVRLIRDGHPVDPEQLRDETYPQIRAMYARLDAARDVDPMQVVEQGYDRIAERYLHWAEEDASGLRQRYAALLLQALPPGASVLELGCGAGVPATRLLARRFQVTGVDLSARQIALARQHVPRARFLQADMAGLDLPPESYDGVAAFYALFHLPRERHPQLLVNIASWLRPGGLLVATMGVHSDAGGVDEDWLGAPMYWSSYDRDTNLRLVREADLEVVRACEETVEEHGQPATFLWIVARKAGMARKAGVARKPGGGA